MSTTDDPAHAPPSGDPGQTPPTGDPGHVVSGDPAQNPHLTAEEPEVNPEPPEEEAK